MNLFALVVYLPDPLGSFVDRLRGELVPGCFAQSHVTVLPPRPLPMPADEAQRSICSRISRVRPFRLELAQVAVFEGTSVIHLDVAKGGEQLRRLHEELNRDGLEFDEPFQYHPHVTLAQEFDPADLPRLRQIAERSWEAYSSSREFSVEEFTFVQNTVGNRWIDLFPCRLGNARPPADQPVSVSRKA